MFYPKLHKIEISSSSQSKEKLNPEISVHLSSSSNAANCSPVVQDSTSPVLLSPARNKTSLNKKIPKYRKPSFDLILLQHSHSVFAVAFTQLVTLKEARNSFFDLRVYLLKSKFHIEDKLRFP